MKERTATIAKAILEALDRMDRVQSSEPILFASVKLMVQPEPVLSEFSEALKQCDARKWIIGVRSTLVETQVKWSISDQGRAALQEI